MELKQQGNYCSKKRKVGIMQQEGIVAKRKRRFICTTDSKHHLPVAENILHQNFGASMPNEKWVSDILLIILWTREGWLYLAVALDLFSRKVVGWSIGQSLKRGLVIRALQMAVQLQPAQSGLLHHSDRGSQYCSYDYQNLLEEYNITCSMSRKGNCYDNAVMESFFAALKQELVYHRQYISHKEAKQDIFVYIHS